MEKKSSNENIHNLIIQNYVGLTEVFVTIFKLLGNMADKYLPVIPAGLLRLPRTKS